MTKPSFRVGTLVRVKDAALTKGIHADTNREYAAVHGYLYIVHEVMDTYVDTLKSVATGEVTCFFLDAEIEEASTDD